MTQTVQDFADLNGYSYEKAERIVTDWAENAGNPGLKKVAQSWLDASA